MLDVADNPERLHILVRQALAHVHDVLYLQGHPLAAALGLAAGPAGRGPALQRLLLDSVAALRPPSSADRGLPAWRRWRCLSLRYLEAAPPERILQELDISGRQMRRDHLEAVATLTSLLWARSRGLSAPGEPALVPKAPPSDPVGVPEADVSAEIARMAGASRESPVSLVEALEAALTLVRLLAESRAVTFAGLAAAPPSATASAGRGGAADRAALVTANRGVLRQVLAALLSYVAEAAPGSHVDTELVCDEPWVRLGLLARRGRAAGADPVATFDASRLEMIRQLAGTQGGTLAWHLDDGGLAIDLRLPAARLATVLVIDDNPDMVCLFERYLQSFGYRVLHATHGPGALELARRCPLDVVTLDLMLPSQDGWEILQLLQSQPETRDVPVVVCSVLREQALALSLGAADFLAKPVTQQVLLSALERCRARRAERPARPSHTPSGAPPAGPLAG